MKNFILVFIFVLSLTHCYQAQSSLKETDNINYQFTIRDSSSNILKNSDALVEISILQGSETGKLIYSEQKKVKTNINGLATIEIGSGTVIFGDYNKIDWAMSPFYLKTKVLNNNSNLLFNGISKFLSVPYALYSKRAGNGIKNIVGNDNGTLTFVFYDGSTYISPNLKGTQGDKGIDGKTTLINSTIEPSGANCLTGGVKIEYGIDTNSNGVLESGEINPSLTKYVCNGTTGAVGAKGDKGEQGIAGNNGLNGKNTLANTVIEPLGANCSTGGVKIEYGIDFNSNGVLESGEINPSLTKYVCNGTTGAVGAKGDKGEQGIAGNNGLDGKNTLANTVIEPLGANCSTGGVKIQYGIDSNSNGVLESGEINPSLTKYVCNGTTGAIGAKGDKGEQGIAGNNGLDGKNTLANTVVEPSGVNCLTGGVKIEYGIDSNSNGVLEIGEINPSLTKYVCNGTTGSVGAKGDKGDKGEQGNVGNNGLDGKNTLAKTVVELSGANCSTGGVKIEYGIDSNNNGVLEIGEINPSLTNYVCNGAKGDRGDKGEQGIAGNNGLDGKNTLANTVVEPSGVNCLTGGVKIEYGIDSNNNGVLEIGEITPSLTKYVCNGTTGSVGAKGDKGDKGEQGNVGNNGLDGKNTLAKTVIEISGANCSSGGVKIEYGIDSNNNGVLEIGEINPSLTKYVCNGTTGPVGVKGDKGDKGEQGIAGTNGLDGKNTLANTVVEASGANCSNGGVKIEYGIDSNNNGVLEIGEINPSLTKYVCNGTNGVKGESGYSALIRTSSENPGLNCINGGTKIETGLDINSNGSLDDNEVNNVQTKFICNILVKNDFLTYSGNSIVSNDTISPLMRFIGDGKEGDFDCSNFNGELIGEHFYKNFKVNANCTLKLGKAQTTIIHVKDTCYITGVIDGLGGLVLPFDEKRDWIGAGGGCSSVGICQSCSFGNYTWTYSPDGLTQLLGYAHSKIVNKETGYNMTLNDLRISSFLGTKINGYSSQKISCGNFSSDYVAQGGSGLIIICKYLIFNGKITLDGSEGKRIVDPFNNVQVIGPGGGGSLIISSDNVIQNNGIISTKKGITTLGNPGAGDGTTYLIFY